MSVIRTSVSVALASVTCLILCGGAAAADPDLLERAKDLYRTAAYDEALGVLDSIPPNSSSADAIQINEYRLFCLLALDRQEEARSAIAALVTADPFYQLPEDQASPRVRAIFKQVRQSVLPSVVQRAYADAKAAYDRGDPGATESFERVLKVLHDPDVAAIGEFADLATVVGAFRDLSKARNAAAAAAPPPAAADRAPAARGGAAPVAPAEPRVYRDGEADVTPAVAISQVMPAAILPGRRVWSGAAELLIDERGNVLSVRIITSINPVYDKQLLQAASTWKYRPATKDGMPVRSAKVISVNVDTRPECSAGPLPDCRPRN